MIWHFSFHSFLYVIFDKLCILQDKILSHPNGSRAFWTLDRQASEKQHQLLHLPLFENNL